MADVVAAEPRQNQPPNGNTRQTHWIIQLIFQLILLRIIYSLFNNYKKNLNVTNTELLKTFKNYIKPGELFDVYGVVTNDIRIDFENIERNGKLVYVNENKTYTYKLNNPYEPALLKIKPNRKFFSDSNEKLYFTVFIIPHKAYQLKNSVFYKSKFKDDFHGHYIIKTIPLTKFKKVTKSSQVRLVGNDTEQLKSKEDEFQDEDGEVKCWIPRVDINLVYDDKNHSPVKNDPYFDSFTKHYKEYVYDPYLYLSQFWVLDENLVSVAKVNREVKQVVNIEKALDQIEIEKKIFLSDLIAEPDMPMPKTMEELDSLISNPEDLNEQSELVDESEKSQDLEEEKKDLYEEGENELELLVNFATCSPLYFMFLSNVNMNKSSNIWGMDNSRELDTIKKTIMNTNPYYLMFSLAFIMLHTFFSIFAFKNDVQFWMNNKSMEGLSTITLFINLVSEIIIALYVYDNENRSFIILFEIFLNIVSSFWKLTKAVKIKFTNKYPFFRITKTSTYIENKTKEYDLIAIKYMSILLAPCVVGYAIYSLYYNKHKSWYSYIISVLAGSVYAFGFIMMTPQLYINYRLKSVEHLPWRALIYKSLNTFVDDVASFLIDMPMLHRLSCFRDDIIFFCYLYQRWKYKVDPKRNNPDATPELEGEELDKLKSE